MFNLVDEKDKYLIVCKSLKRLKRFNSQGI